jgi:D-alanyl-lipoteichoic acid acyltransferase DltB (MBOAT superfamily)
MYFFTIQIYCDFSGYSDIARGCARVMGYELMVNFKVPFLVLSIQEHWAKWHISLSSWFRDYLYIPLGGNRVSKWRRQFNIFLVFFISGLWHGANWTYIIWGSLHGIYLIMANIRRDITKVREEDSKSFFIDFLNWFWTFHLIVITFIVFRASSMAEAYHTFMSIATTTHVAIINYLHHVPVLKGFGRYDVMTIALLFAGAIGLVGGEYVVNTPKFRAAFYKHAALRMVMYFAIFYAIIFLGYFGETQFIYFQF